MATQKKYTSKRNHPPKDTFIALSNPIYPRNVDKGKELDIKIRTLTNYFWDKELEGINATWKVREGNFKPIRRSPTVRESLNKSTGGKRKRNSTKKKRRNKTKKRTTKK